jgi:peptidyl-Lys metalloendopeptidase
MKIVILSLIISIVFALDVSINLISTSPLAVNFTVSNPGETDQTFLQWGTPFEGVWDDMFDIRDDKFNRVPYAGILMLRGKTPIDEEFVTVPAGGIRTVTVDLGENYEFTSTGKYMVRINLPEYSELIYSTNDNQVEVFKLETIPERRPVEAPLAYRDCSSTQISQTDAAVRGSITASSRSVTCLNSGCDSLYRTWFGTQSTTNFNYVSSVFRNVHARLNGYAFNCWCNAPGCGSNTYGYVYATDSTYVVHLCSLFWSIPGERVNTVVHEMSHFNSLGGTRDYAYGESACKSLAVSNPTNACHNADNICYFAHYV